MSNFPVGGANDPNMEYNRQDPEMIPFEAEERGCCQSCMAEVVDLESKRGLCQDCYEADPEYYEEDDVIFDKGYDYDEER